MRPMLATPGPLPSGPGWAFEVKWDGIRAMAQVSKGRLRVIGRSGKDHTAAFPELADLVGAVPEGTLLDGELVALDEDGRPCFSSILARLHANSPSRAEAGAVRNPVALLFFDLLRFDGVDLTGRAYHERRTALESAMLSARSWRVPASFDDGPALLVATAEQGLEGVVAKRLNSPYQVGVRSSDWVKVPHRRTRSVVVGGYRPGSSPGRHRIGSLLVGTPVGDGLLSYDGAIGSGLSQGDQRAVRELIDATLRAEAPFDPPTDERFPRDALWCEPHLVVDVVHLGRGGHGLLRQGAVDRLRPDRTYAELLAEGG